MTPVPGLAGNSSTRDARYSPRSPDVELLFQQRLPTFAFVGLLRRLFNRQRNFNRLAVTIAHTPMAVAGHDQSGKTESDDRPSRRKRSGESESLVRRNHFCCLHSTPITSGTKNQLKIQTRFTSSICESRNTAVITKLAPIKHDFGDPEFPGAFGNQPADFPGAFGITAKTTRPGNFSFDRTGRDQSFARSIINNLRVHMSVAAEYRQARSPVCIPNNSIPDAILTPLILFRQTRTNTHC
jgi:hypothetical protein